MINFLGFLFFILEYCLYICLNISAVYGEKITKKIMIMKLQVHYAPYAGYSFKVGKKSIKNLSELWVIDSENNKGKIKLTGSQKVYEHGYFGVSENYSFIDTEINSRSLDDGEIFTILNPKLATFTELTDNLLKLISKNNILEVNGFDGSWTYKIE